MSDYLDYSLVHCTFSNFKLLIMKKQDYYKEYYKNNKEKRRDYHRQYMSNRRAEQRTKIIAEKRKKESQSF
jgi:hypothetical protein